MSGTINIYLMVLTRQTIQTEVIMKEFDWYAFDSQHAYEANTYYEFSECREPKLPFVETLTRQGIAFDQNWNDDSGESGMIAQRFTSTGESRNKTLDDCHKNPDTEGLINLIDKPTELRNYILEHQASRLILPWDNQEQYGQLYRARQLINA